MNICEEIYSAQQKNYRRLLTPPYTVDEIFRPATYDWPGDWEGRALLAFALHERMGNRIPCLREMIARLPEKTNGSGYFGTPFCDGQIDEQQLSGHNWYLRGLLCLAQDGSPVAAEYAQKTVENLFLPALAHYDRYPIHTRTATGGVSGNRAETCNGWKLSTDVGCAFMPLDGLAAYYKMTRDARVKTGFEKAAALYVSLDFVGLQMQTHATLSALRGLLTFYEATGEQKYLTDVRRIVDVYCTVGMTLTYENFNWFGRPDTWTEPCAVVDSLILAVRLYRLTGEERYKKTARRIACNGLSFCLRNNGGAGPNTCVTAQQPYLRVSMYEAPFCCTMRFAEGLRYLSENQALFARQSDTVSEEDGRYFLDDRLLVQDERGTFADRRKYRVAGKDLIVLPSLCDIDEQAAKDVCLRVYFG